MSKNLKRQIRERMAQSQPAPDPNMYPEFEYKTWVIPYDNEKAAEMMTEISEYLSQKSCEGWGLQGAPREAFQDNHLVIVALLARAKERKVLAPVGLA